jgi:hypothetical protein
VLTIYKRETIQKRDGAMNSGMNNGVVMVLNENGGK